MSDETDKGTPSAKAPTTGGSKLRLPRMVRPEDEGIGDVISRMTRSVGIKPCGGCEQRQAALNNMFPFKR